MHLAYSALKQTSKSTHTADMAKANHIKKLRYKGYKAACHKYQQEIAAIQKYIPGWKPDFR
jgi:hypothetical protein